MGVAGTSAILLCGRSWLIVGAAFRLLHTTLPARSPSVEGPIPTSSTSATEPITQIAKRGSNQLSLETPNNKAGRCLLHAAFVRHELNVSHPEYVLSTIDKVVNWARQGSMWPMTFGTEFRTCFWVALRNHSRRFGVLRRRDDAHGCCPVRPGSSWGCVPCQSSPVGHHDRRGYPHEQDGACAAKGVRPDA